MLTLCNYILKTAHHVRKLLVLENRKKLRL